MAAEFDSDLPETYEWEVDFLGGGTTLRFGTDETLAREHARPFGRTLRRRLVIRRPWEVVIEAKSRVRDA